MQKLIKDFATIKKAVFPLLAFCLFFIVSINFLFACGASFATKSSYYDQGGSYEYTEATGASAGYSPPRPSVARSAYDALESAPMSAPVSADYAKSDYYSDAEERNYRIQQTRDGDLVNTTTSTAEPVPASTPPTKSPDRLVIYQASVQMEVVSLESAKKTVIEYVESIKGFIQSSTNNTITVRIPAPLFNQSIEKLADWGTILQKNISSQDVTESFMDLSIRLDNARQVRESLQKMLTVAQTVEEMLQIQKEIARLTDMIQEMEDQLSQLSDLISFSTITIILQETSLARVDTRNPFKWIQSIGFENFHNAQ